MILIPGHEDAFRTRQSSADASTAGTNCANCVFFAAAIRSMIPAPAERMLPAPSRLVQFTGRAAAPKRRPADARTLAGPFSLKE